MSLTFKPDRFNLILGVLLCAFLVLGFSWIAGFVALAAVREPPPAWLIAFLLAAFAGMSFGFTHIANLCLFRVRLSDDGVRIRGVLRDRRVRIDELGEIYFTENFKYAHVILSVGRGAATMSSLLWSNKRFHDLMAEVKSWAVRLGRPEPVEVDTVNPGSDEASKRAARKLRAAFRRDWLAYALILAVLIVSSALIQAVFRVGPVARAAPDASVVAKGAAVGGVTRMRCSVTADGRLGGCVVVFECPRGRGFGDAALKAARYFKMRPKTTAGRPADGGQVVIPIKWQIKGAVIPPDCLRPARTP